MNYRNFFLCFSIILILSLNACIASVGDKISVSKIPAIESSDGAGSLARASVTAIEVVDVREGTIANNSEPERTEATGEVSQVLQQAISNELRKKGAQLGVGDKQLRVEIREWHNTATAKGAVELNSKAALYTEVIDGSGESTYSGVYQGSRSSTFPIASANDIEQSLGIAMSEAIGEALKDGGLIKELSVN